MKIEVKDVSKEFRHYLVDNFEFQKDAATHFGVSTTLVSLVARGKKKPTGKMLDAMGIKLAYIKK